MFVDDTQVYNIVNDAGARLQVDGVSRSAFFSTSPAGSQSDVFTVAVPLPSRRRLAGADGSRVPRQQRSSSSLAPGSVLVLKSKLLGEYGRIASTPAATSRPIRVSIAAAGGLTMVFDQSSPSEDLALVYSGSGLSYRGVALVSGPNGALTLANSSSGLFEPAAAVIKIVAASELLLPPPPKPSSPPAPPATLLGGATYSITLGETHVPGHV